jgi:hypothetical protein
VTAAIESSAPDPRARVKVLHIAGLHRTGSTILANALGEVPGFFAAGELIYLSRTIALRDSCGCGEALTDCGTWTRILESAFAREDDAILGLGFENWWLATHNLPRLMLADRRGDPDLERFRNALAAVCRAIAATTGAGVVVETSKRPTFGWLLRDAPGLDVYAVHLVRDPRATAYSWQRANLWATPAGVGAAWTGWHAAISLQWMRRHDRYLPVRYEDFVRAPRRVLLDVLALVGESGSTLPFVDDHTLRLHPNHTVQANENRFRTGDVPVRADEAWRRQLPPRAALAAMATSWPLRLKWGYRLGGRRIANDAQV